MNDTASHWLACSAALLMILKEVTTFQPAWLAAAFSASSVVAVTANDGRVAIQRPQAETSCWKLGLCRWAHATPRR
jgi:hypothetical protein